MSRRPAEPGIPGEARPRVLTVEEAAKILRISRGLAFAAVRSGEIPHVRIGRRILIPDHALKALLAHEAKNAPREDTSGWGNQSARDNPADAKLAGLRELANTLESLISELEPNRT